MAGSAIIAMATNGRADDAGGGGEERAHRHQPRTPSPPRTPPEQPPPISTRRSSASFDFLQDDTHRNEEAGWRIEGLVGDDAEDALRERAHQAEVEHAERESPDRRRERLRPASVKATGKADQDRAAERGEHDEVEVLGDHGRTFVGVRSGRAAPVSARWPARRKDQGDSLEPDDDAEGPATSDFRRNEAGMPPTEIAPSPRTCPGVAARWAMSNRPERRAGGLSSRTSAASRDRSRPFRVGRAGR